MTYVSASHTIHLTGRRVPRVRLNTRIHINKNFVAALIAVAISVTYAYFDISQIRLAPMRPAFVDEAFKNF